MLTAFILWTAAGLLAQRCRSLHGVWQIINGLLAGLALLGILSYTVIGRAERTQSVPFIRTIAQIRAQPELLREMLMNAFLFFPLGLTLPYVLHGKIHPARSTVLIAFLLTCGIELVQYLCGFGNAELSDICMNTLGAAFGSLSFVICNKYKQRNRA